MGFPQRIFHTDYLEWEYFHFPTWPASWFGSQAVRVFFNLWFCFSEGLSETFSSSSAILTGSIYLSRDQLCKFWGRKIRKLSFLPFEAIQTSKDKVFIYQRDIK